MRVALALTLLVALPACAPDPAVPAEEPARFFAEALCADRERLRGVEAVAVTADAYTASLQIGEGAPPVVSSDVEATGPLPAEVLAFAPATLYTFVAQGEAPAVEPCEAVFPADAFGYLAVDSTSGQRVHVLSGDAAPGDTLRFLIAENAAYDLVGLDITTPAPGTGGPTLISVRWSDFRDADGLRFPHRATVELGGVREALDPGEIEAGEAAIAALDVLGDLVSDARRDEILDEAGGDEVLSLVRAIMRGEPVTLEANVASLQVTRSAPAE